MDPLQAYQCMAQGGVPDPQLGCVPAAIYPAIRQCVNQGGTWEPYLGVCIPKVTGVPGAKAGWAETAARVACAAMGGQWDDASKTCGGPAVAQQYSLSELSNQPTSCPASAPVSTPEGCKPWPVPAPPTGRPTPTPGSVPVPGGTPGVPQAKTTPTESQTTAAVVVDESKDDWVLPAALIGGGLLLYFFVR